MSYTGEVWVKLSKGRIKIAPYLFGETNLFALSPAKVVDRIRTINFIVLETVGEEISYDEINALMNKVIDFYDNF